MTCAPEFQSGSLLFVMLSMWNFLADSQSCHSEGVHKTTVCLFEDRRECSECFGSSEPPDGLASNSRSSPDIFPRYSYFTGASTCYCFSGKQDQLTEMILLMIMLYKHMKKKMGPQNRNWGNVRKLRRRRHQYF